MILSILHDHRTINIAIVILLTFAGIYGYYELLGRPGGLLRQLLVGIPLGVVYGVSTYYFNIKANYVLSNALGELVRSPAIPVSSITIGVIAFLSGLAFPILSPNFFRMESERKKLSTSTIVLLFLFNVMFGTFWNSLGILSMFKLLSPWVSFHPPLPGVIIVAFVLSALAFYYSYFYANAQLGLLGPGNNMAPGKFQPTFLGCIVNIVVVVPAISLTIYFVMAAGWVSLIYFGILFITGVLITLLQYGVDHMKDLRLLQVSLFLFLLAAALQLYQVIAL